MRASQFKTTSTAAAAAAREEHVLDSPPNNNPTKGPSASTVLREAYSLFDSFLKQNSPYEVNVSAMTRKRIEAQLQSMSKAVNAMAANQFSSSAIKAALPPPPPPHVAISLFAAGSSSSPHHGTASLRGKTTGNLYATGNGSNNNKRGTIAIADDDTEHFLLESIRSVFDEAVIGM
jgi:hypothetical protein